MTRLCCPLSMAAAPSRSASTIHSSLPPAGSRVRWTKTTTAGRAAADLRCRRRLLSARGEHPDPDEQDEDEEVDEPAAGGFEAAAALFNGGEYHACHDAAEELLWRCADEEGGRARTLLHGLLQCAVGMHHLIGRNHRGAMLELGQGLCNLRRLDLDHDSDHGRPFARFRDEIAALLAFLYRTQKELAACTEEMCVAMDGSATTYQLLGDFAAGQRLYRLGAGEDGVPAIVFSAGGGGGGGRSSVKLPVLHATERHLAALQRAH